MHDWFSSVVGRYFDSVLRAAFHITQNSEDARDVAQQVFTQFYICPPPILDKDRVIERWLYVVTRNEAFLINRRTRRDQELSVMLLDEIPQQRGPEEIVLQREFGREVRSTIALLPIPDRTVIELRYLEAMSTSELALEFGIPIKLVKRDVERAKHRLRKVILQGGIESESLHSGR